MNLQIHWAHWWRSWKSQPMWFPETCFVRHASRSWNLQQAGGIHCQSHAQLHFWWVDPKGKEALTIFPLLSLGNICIITVSCFIETQALSRSRCYPAAVRYAEGVWLCGGLTRRNGSRLRYSKVCRIWKDTGKMHHISWFYKVLLLEHFVRIEVCFNVFFCVASRLWLESLILQVFGWHWRLFGLSGIPFFGCQQLVSWPTIVAAPRLSGGCRIEDTGDGKRWRVAFKHGGEDGS